MKFEALSWGYEIVEGPRVDSRNRLYFTCSKSGVHRRDPGGEVTRLIDRPWVGGLLFNQEGGLVMSGRTLALWDERDGSLRDIFSQWQGKPVPGLNDLTVDDHGNIYVGVMGFDINTFDPSWRTPPPGSLFRVAPTGQASLLHEGILVPNGIAFSPDRKLLYQNDTMTHAVWVFDVASDGSVRDRRLFHRFELNELPDGLAVDVEGALWIAVAKGRGEIVRIKPDGIVDRVVKVPSTFVTSLAFAGPDLTELYVTTANNSEDPSRKGTIFRTRVDVPGLAVPEARFPLN